MMEVMALVGQKQFAQKQSQTDFRNQRYSSRVFVIGGIDLQAPIYKRQSYDIRRPKRSKLGVFFRNTNNRTQLDQETLSGQEFRNSEQELNTSYDYQRMKEAHPFHRHSESLPLYLKNLYFKHSSTQKMRRNRSPDISSLAISGRASPSLEDLERRQTQVHITPTDNQLEFSKNGFDKMLKTYNNSKQQNNENHDYYQYKLDNPSQAQNLNTRFKSEKFIQAKEMEQTLRLTNNTNDVRTKKTQRQEGTEDIQQYQLVDTVRISSNMSKNKTELESEGPQETNPDKKKPSLKEMKQQANGQSSKKIIEVQFDSHHQKIIESLTMKSSQFIDVDDEDQPIWKNLHGNEVEEMNKIQDDIENQKTFMREENPILRIENDMEHTEKLLTQESNEMPKRKRNIIKENIENASKPRNHLESGLNSRSKNSRNQPDHETRWLNVAPSKQNLLKEFNIESSKNLGTSESKQMDHSGSMWLQPRKKRMSGYFGHMRLSHGGAQLSSGNEQSREPTPEVEIKSCIESRRLLQAKEKQEVKNVKDFKWADARRAAKRLAEDYKMSGYNDYSQITLNSNVYSKGTLAQNSIQNKTNEDIKNAMPAPIKIPVAKQKWYQDPLKLNKLNLDVIVNQVPSEQKKKMQSNKDRNSVNSRTQKEKLKKQLIKLSKQTDRNQHTIFDSSSSRFQMDKNYRMVSRSGSDKSLNIKQNLEMCKNIMAGFMPSSRIQSQSSVITPTLIDSKRELSFRNIIRAPKFTEENDKFIQQYHTAKYNGEIQTPLQQSTFDHLNSNMKDVDEPELPVENTSLHIKKAKMFENHRTQTDFSQGICLQPIQSISQSQQRGSRNDESKRQLCMSPLQANQGEPPGIQHFPDYQVVPSSREEGLIDQANNTDFQNWLIQKQHQFFNLDLAHKLEVFSIQKEIAAMLDAEDGQVTFSHGERDIKDKEENDYIISNDISVKAHKVKAVYEKMKVLDKILEEASHPYKKLIEFKESQDYPIQYLSKVNEQRQSIQSIKIEGEPVKIIKQLKAPSTPQQSIINSRAKKSESVLSKWGDTVITLVNSHSRETSRERYQQGEKSSNQLFAEFIENYSLIQQKLSKSLNRKNKHMPQFSLLPMHHDQEFLESQIIKLGFNIINSEEQDRKEHQNPKQTIITETEYMKTPHDYRGSDRHLGSRNSSKMQMFNMDLIKTDIVLEKNRNEQELMKVLDGPANSKSFQNHSGKTNLTQTTNQWGVGAKKTINISIYQIPEPETFNQNTSQHNTQHQRTMVSSTKMLRPILQSSHKVTRRAGPSNVSIAQIIDSSQDDKSTDLKYNHNEMSQTFHGEPKFQPSTCKRPNISNSNAHFMKHITSKESGSSTSYYINRDQQKMDKRKFLQNQFKKEQRSISQTLFARKISIHTYNSSKETNQDMSPFSGAPLLKNHKQQNTNSGIVLNQEDNESLINSILLQDKSPLRKTRPPKKGLFTKISQELKDALQASPRLAKMDISMLKPQFQLNLLDKQNQLFGGRNKTKKKAFSILKSQLQPPELVKPISPNEQPLETSKTTVPHRVHQPRSPMLEPVRDFVEGKETESSDFLNLDGRSESLYLQKLCAFVDKTERNNPDQSFDITNYDSNQNTKDNFHQSVVGLYKRKPVKVEGKTSISFFNKNSRVKATRNSQTFSQFPAFPKVNRSHNNSALSNSYNNPIYPDTLRKGVRRSIRMMYAGNN